VNDYIDILYPALAVGVATGFTHRQKCYSNFQLCRCWKPSIWREDNLANWPLIL